MTGFTRDAGAADLPVIDHLFRTSFGGTFGHLYNAEDLAFFLAGFTPEAWQSVHDDPRFALRLAELDGRPVGYAKIGPMALPADHGPDAVQLYQLYLLDDAKGRGIAGELMEWVFTEARARGADALFLSVFVENQRARRFYQRHGFVDVGPYHFLVGDQADEDVVMKVAL
ncbi:MAG: GNAT family N-acetyltransferase [Sphingomonas sp.]|nr:GNAT family N-acetyltransferase [Sphingomonas sp.]